MVSKEILCRDTIHVGALDDGLRLRKHLDVKTCGLGGDRRTWKVPDSGVQDHVCPHFLYLLVLPTVVTSLVTWPET